MKRKTRRTSRGNREASEDETKKRDLMDKRDDAERDREKER